MKCELLIDDQECNNNSGATATNITDPEKINVCLEHAMLLEKEDPDNWEIRIGDCLEDTCE